MEPRNTPLTIPLRSCATWWPHVMADTWAHGYTRSQAAFPAPWLRDHKFWPHVGRIDNAHGDRNLICACTPIEAYADAGSGD